MSNYGENYYLEELEEMKKEKVVTIIPDKQIIIDKSDLDFIHKQYKDKIADLEAKLAESENKAYVLQTKLNMKEYEPVFCRLAGRDCEELGKVEQLKQQLAEERKKVIERIRDLAQIYTEPSAKGFDFETYILTEENLDKILDKAERGSYE